MKTEEKKTFSWLEILNLLVGNYSLISYLMFNGSTDFGKNKNKFHDKQTHNWIGLLSIF